MYRFYPLNTFLCSLGKSTLLSGANFIPRLCPVSSRGRGHSPKVSVWVMQKSVTRFLIRWYWNQLPREDVDSPSLESLCLHHCLQHFVFWIGWILLQLVGQSEPSEVPVSRIIPYSILFHTFSSLPCPWGMGKWAFSSLWIGHLLLTVLWVLAPSPAFQTEQGTALQTACKGEKIFPCWFMSW